MRKIYTCNLILILIFALHGPGHCEVKNNVYPWKKNTVNYTSIQSTFQPPHGFRRVKVNENSYQDWLRNLPLLQGENSVLDYLGNIKVSPQDTTLAAIIDYDIAGKKLEQCMDIIIRFRAEYLLYSKQENKINFYLPVNFELKWNDWKTGLRPKFSGIDIVLQKTANKDTSRESFENFLWKVFYYSSTQTAYFNYPKVKFADVQIGDFVVKRGKKGHAILILDLAVDSLGNKIGLIGHGDTPARQFYILNYKQNNPWFPLNPTDEYLPMPFRKKMHWEGLRRFP